MTLSSGLPCRGLVGTIVENNKGKNDTESPPDDQSLIGKSAV
ncbi:hypothetical protein [Pasteurella testudinis]|nr:hypothetical protein [Pasteurella testudinis]